MMVLIYYWFRLVELEAIKALKYAITLMEKNSLFGSTSSVALILLQEIKFLLLISSGRI